MKWQYIVLVILVGGTLYGQEGLRLDARDVRVDREDNGLLLRVRKLDGIASVLLTESTRDPQRTTPAYGLRNSVYHPTNGDEPRKLDGKFLASERSLYFLIDSTPLADPHFGEAFHIYIPEVVSFGYPWSRNGALRLEDGLFLNIRTFALPYADYSGSYRDNPFTLRIPLLAQAPDSPALDDEANQSFASADSLSNSLSLPQSDRVLGRSASTFSTTSLEPSIADFRPDALAAFRDIASETDGLSLLSSGEQDVLTSIDQILRSVDETALDLVLAIDTTRSMRNDLPFLQRQLRPLLERYDSYFDPLRVGLVYYRDYREEYLTRTVDFSTNLEYIQSELDAIAVDGGADVPEAVYEALNIAITHFPWRASKRVVILIGDAPPHTRPRGDIDRNTVYREARARGIELHTIILPQ